MYDGLDDRLYFDTVHLDELQALRELLDGPSSAEPAISTRSRRSQPQPQPQPRAQQSQAQPKPHAQPQPQSQPKPQVKSQAQTQPNQQSQAKAKHTNRASQRANSTTSSPTAADVSRNNSDSENRSIANTAGSSKSDNVTTRSSTSPAASSTATGSTTPSGSAGPVVLSFTFNTHQRTQVPKQFAKKTSEFVPLTSQKSKEPPQDHEKSTPAKQTPAKQTPPKSTPAATKTPKSAPSAPEPALPTPSPPRPSLSRPASSEPPTPSPSIYKTPINSPSNNTPPIASPSEPAESEATQAEVSANEIDCDLEVKEEQSNGSELENEPPPTYDKYGLPSNLDERFHRWLYGDMTAFQSGGVSKKRLEDEVRPPPVEAEKIITCCNEVDTDHGIIFITQDIDLDKPLPVEEILIPSLKLRASSSLAATANSHIQLTADTCQAETNQQSNGRALDGDTPGKRRKPRLTITLEVHRTIIDRRPMIRKMKSKPQTVASQLDDPGEQVSSTSLIAPGEDCDDSDDNEVIEVDCDDTGLHFVSA